MQRDQPNTVGVEGVETAVDGLPQDVHRYWHSPLLEFYDRDLEKKYLAYCSRGAVDVDKKFCRLGFVLITALQLTLIWRSRNSLIKPSNAFHWAAVCNSLTAFVHGLWMFTAPKELLVTRRTVVVVIVRLVYIITFSIPQSVPELFGHTIGFFWWRCMVDSGVVMANWLALSLPLLFKHHLWLQTLGLVMQTLLLTGRFCSHAKAFERSLTHELPDYLDKEMCDTSASAMGVSLGFSQLSAMYQGIVRAVQGVPVLNTGSPNQPPVLESSCIRPVLFLQLALGWFLPTAMLHIVERRSRAHFLLHLEREHVYEADLFMLEMEKKLRESTQFSDCISRALGVLLSVLKCLVFVVVAWHLLVLLWVKAARMEVA